jgi:hypothetical protein
MAEELFDRVLREVRERKKRAEAAWEESRRLEAALRALEGQRSRPRPQRQTAPTRPRSSGRRAPRGQTRGAILQVVAERAGATAAEIAAAANLDRRVTQSTLARLARQGAIERYSPAGGGTAYRPPSPTRGSHFTSAASPTAGGVEERESSLAEDDAVDTANEQRERDAPATDREPDGER